MNTIHFTNLPDDLPVAENEEQKKQELEFLKSAFQTFNETTRHLQESYDKLQERLNALDLELEAKNLELEKNLQEKERVKNYLNNILESLTTGVIVVDENTRITTFNKTAGIILGMTAGQCLNQPLADTGIQPLAELVQSSGGQTRMEDHEITTRDQRQVHIRLSASPVQDPAGHRMGTVLILQDITQLKRLEEEAQRNQRLRAMGEMAAGIAHEIRNPLGGIELFASMLKKDLAQDPEKRPLTEHIISGVKNMDRIISSLLLFAKSPEPSRQQCNLNHLLKDIVNASADFQCPDNVKIHHDLAVGEAVAAGDEELLRQVFLNFIRNAVQAMPDGGSLRLTTQTGNTADSRSHITVTVADTGVGIAAQDQKNIFNPFFSTKDKGTGLGLAIAHNIIKAHQGTIDVESETGQGTKFIIKIPAWDEN